MNLFERTSTDPEQSSREPAGSPLRPLPTPKAPRLNRNALTIIAAACGMIVVAVVIFIQPSAPNDATRGASTAPPTATGTYLDQPVRRSPSVTGTTSAPQPYGAAQPYAGTPGVAGRTVESMQGTARMPANQGVSQAPVYPTDPGPQMNDRAVGQSVGYDPAIGSSTAGAAAIGRAGGTARESTAAELRVAAFRRALSAAPVAGLTGDARRDIGGGNVIGSAGVTGSAEPPAKTAFAAPRAAETADSLALAATVGHAAAAGDASSDDELAQSPTMPRSRAEQFMQTAAQDAQRRRVSQALTVDPAPGPFTVQAGTVIPAVLMTEMNSDLPGECLAQITRDVFDSRSQQTLLIPRGAKLLCTYDDQLATGQSRLLVAWTRILLPDGRSVSLPGLPATDQAGARGVSDQVDRHARRAFGTAAALSLISAGAQLAMPQRGSIFSPPSVGQVAAQALGQQLNQVAVQMLQRDLRNQQTIRIRQGTEFNVFLNTDLVFPGPYASGARAGSSFTVR